MTLEQKGIAVFIAGILLTLSGAYTVRIFVEDVPKATFKEFMRAKADQTQVMNVKCLEPMAEFREAETKYLQTYGLLFHPTNKYDILSINDPKENQQYNDAQELKMVEELAVQLCADAKAENVEIKESDKWDYFKAHWKEMMFNVK